MPGRGRGIGGAGIPSSLRRGSYPTRAIPSLMAGAVIGVSEVAVAASFGALIFAGGLEEHTAAGIGLSLFAATVFLALIAVTSSVPGIIASTQDSTAAILALVAASAAAAAPPERAFLTAVATIAVSSIATGAVFVALGAFRLGNLIRFVPYPVIGGFLAGTGWLLVRGGMAVAGTPLSLAGLTDLATPEALAKWLPAVGFAVVLTVVARRSRHPALLPAGVLASVALFYVVLFASGGSIAEAQSQGWMLSSVSGETLWRPWSVDALGSADWSAVAGEAGSIATLVVVAVLSLLLNVSGIELVVGRDAEIDRELRVAGVANAAAGLGGGMVGFQTLTLTALADQMGARNRGVGILAAAFCGIALLFGGTVPSLVPTFVLGGLLVYLGLGFLIAWLYDSRARLPVAEYLVVPLILVVIAVAGLLPGVAVGIVIALVLFVVTYSRTDVVKHAFSGAAYRSNVERPDVQREALRSRGDAILVLQLQGFMFFGTANPLLDRIRARVRDPSLPPLRFLVMDFRRVTGLDASAVLSFIKAHQLATAHGFTMVFAGLSPQLRRQLEHGAMLEEAKELVEVAPDLDRGVQWCEDRLLSDARIEEAGPESPWRLVRERLGEEGEEDRLAAHLERVEVPAGDVVIRQGERSRDVYFLESGRLGITLVTATGQEFRLRSVAAGTVVGEAALYGAGIRTASVVAEAPSVLYRLRAEAFKALEESDPQLAVAVHRLFGRLLSERLSDSLRTLEALMD